jgi:transmembrane sensor
VDLRPHIQGWADERVRQQAARWFARLRGPQAEAHQPGFQRWLAGSPTHRVAYDRLLLHWENTAVLSGSSVQLSSSLPLRRSSGRPVGLGLAIGLAASLVLAAGLALLAAEPGRAAREALGWPTTLRSRVGQIRVARLGDGSTLTLDTDSIVSTHFSHDDRGLSLQRGRARFEVRHDAHRPFEVTAAGVVVVAHGTVFDVTLEQDHQVAVALIRGAVDVLAKAAPGRPGSAGAFVATLKPGQKIALGPRGAAVAQTAHGMDAQWPSGMMSFDGATLEAVLNAANRYSLKKLRVDDPSLGQRAVTGVFRSGAPDAMAHSLAAALDLEVQDRGGDGLTLRRPSQ